jgi:hypothetical protein
MLEGTLQTNGNLRLISNSSGSASIGEIKSGAAVSGNLELQRYTPPIPSTQGYWFNLSCPIQGQTIASWNDDIVTTGFTGSDYPTYGFNNVQYYNESASGTMNTGYVGVTNVTNAIETNRGYYVWLAGAAQNFDNTGLIQSGEVTMPLSYTVTSPGGIFDYGWNLVGNPYPSEVDWNLVSASLSGPKVYYVYDYQSSSYKFRNATTNTGTASRYIAHSQGFLVKVNATGQNLVFQESHKTNTGAAFERSEDASASYVALRFSKGTRSDESMVFFSTEAHEGYDEYDVAHLQSMASDAVEMHLQAQDGAPLAQDARPYSGNIEIPVVVEMPEAGTYQFTVVDIQNMPLGACLTIEDVVTGEVTSLAAGMIISVTCQDPFQGQRFIIRSTPSAQAIVTGTSCHQVADGSIDVMVPSNDWNVSLSAQNGYEFMAQGSVTFDHLQAGEYLLQVEHGTCGVSSQVFEVEQPQAVRTVITGSDAVDCNQGSTGMISFEVEHATWFTYELRNSANQLVHTANIEGNTAFVEGLPADVYTIHIYTPCNNEILEADLRDELANTIVVDQQLTVVGESELTALLTAQTAQPGICTWSFSNGLQFTGNEVELLLSGGETIQYTVLCAGVCDASSQGSIQALSISNVEQAQGQEIDFTQAAEMIQLKFGNVEATRVDARIFDAQGRLVESTSFMMNGGGIQAWSTSTLAKGSYTLVLGSGSDALFTRKFIK